MGGPLNVWGVPSTSWRILHVHHTRLFGDKKKCHQGRTEKLISAVSVGNDKYCHIRKPYNTISKQCNIKFVTVNTFQQNRKYVSAGIICCSFKYTYILLLLRQIIQHSFTSNGTFYMFQQCIVSSLFEIQKSVTHFPLRL